MASKTTDAILIVRTPRIDCCARGLDSQDGGVQRFAGSIPEEARLGRFMPAKLKILFVLNSLSVGGPQRSTIAFIRRLDLNRYHVTVLLLNPHRDELAKLLPNQVELLMAPPRLRAALLESEQGFRSLFFCMRHFGLGAFVGLLRATFTEARRRPLNMNRVRQRLWGSVIKELPPIRGSYDVGFGILGMSSYVLADLCRVTRKFHWIRSDATILQRITQLDAEIYARLDGAIAVSRETAAIFEELFPVVSGQVRVYKNDLLRLGRESAPLEFQFPQEPVPVISTISRLDPLKGLDIAIAAAKELRRVGFSFVWLIAGEGPERQRLEGLIKDSNLSANVFLLGNVKNPEAVLQRSTIYVHPSRTEGRSNAIEEAKAQGLPVLCTAFTTAGSHITDGRSGVICQIEPRAVADAVSRLLGDRNMRSRLGAAARREHEQERDDPDRLIEGLLGGF